MSNLRFRYFGLSRPHGKCECLSQRNYPISGNVISWEADTNNTQSSVTLTLNGLVVWYWHFSNPGCLSDLWYQIDFQVIYFYESWTSYLEMSLACLALITLNWIDSQTDRIVSLWHYYLCSVLHSNFWLPRYVSTKHGDVYSRLIWPFNLSFTETFCETY